MNLVEVNDGVAVITFKALVSKRLKSKINKSHFSTDKILMYAIGLFISGSFFLMHWFFGLCFFCVFFSLFANTIGQVNKETYFKFLLRDNILYFISMNKDLDHREQFNADSIEQFYIKKVGEDQFNLMIIYKKMEVNHESDLLSFGHKRIAEITDILDYMHQFYGITPKKIEDEYNYDKKTNFIPKQKRNFFKLFDQDIEDIRTKGVFTLSGEDYLVEKTQQIEWDNGMVSYRFLIHEDQSLFYHPMINNRLLFLESKALKANIDGFDRYVDSLNEQPKVLSFEGQNYYLLEVNKGEISMDGKHLHEELLQTIYESEDEKCVLRCSQMEDKIRVFKGTMMQEKQINLILPQLDVDF